MTEGSVVMMPTRVWQGHFFRLLDIFSTQKWNFLSFSIRTMPLASRQKLSWYNLVWLSIVIKTSKRDLTGYNALQVLFYFDFVEKLTDDVFLLCDGSLRVELYVSRRSYHR